MAQARKASRPLEPTRKTGRARPEPRAPSGEPYLRFHHPAALRKKTLAVLESVETSADPTEHRKALAEIVVELTRCGLESYFMKPLKLAKAGFITEQTASLGMAGSVQVLSSVIRNIIGGMGAPQLISVCGSIRRFME